MRVEPSSYKFSHTTIIVAYSPTNTSDKAITEDFNRKLSDTIHEVPAHNVLLVIGDLNARVGPDHVNHPYHSETNRNGKFLMDLLTDNRLVIGNTYFQKGKQ